MTAQPRSFERLLAEMLNAEGPQSTPAGYLDDSIEAALATPQRHPLVRALDVRAWPRGRALPAIPRSRRSMVLAAVLVAVTLALVAATAWFGSGPAPSPRPTAASPTSALHASTVTLTDGPDTPNPVVTPIGLRSGGILSLLWAPEGKLAAAILGSDRTGWRDLGPVPFAMTDGEPILLEDGRVFLLAQKDQAGGIPSAVIFDPSTERFAPGVVAGIARSGGMTVALADGRVMVLGGSPDASGVLQQGIEVFDPVLEQWSSVGSLQLYGTTLGLGPVRLADGRVLVTTYQPDSGAPLGLVIVDPGTGASVQSRVDLPDDAGGIVGFDVMAVQAQPDGQVLFFGAMGDGGMAHVAAWRPGEVKLRPFANVPGGFQALGLRDGRFLVLDGSVGAATVWDPVIGTTEHIGPFATTYPLAVALADGQVALIGGYVRGAPIGSSGTPPVSRAVQFLRFE